VSPIEVRDEGDIRWIGLNRPDKRNAIDQATTVAFAAAPADARKQPCQARRLCERRAARKDHPAFTHGVGSPSVSRQRAALLFGTSRRIRR